MRPTRPLRLLVVAVALALCLVPAANAGTADEARAVAEQFVGSLVHGDAASACVLVSGRFNRALGSGGCAEAFDDEESHDLGARFALLASLQAAQEIASGSPNGRFPATARALRRQISALVGDAETPFTYVIGTGPGVVKNQEPSVVGIDRIRSNATTVVFYVESDSGTIFKLVGSLQDEGAISAAGRGRPAPPDVPANLVISSTAVLDGPAAIVTVTLQADGQTSVLLVRLVEEGGVWRVDEIYFPLSELFRDRQPL